MALIALPALAQSGSTGSGNNDMGTTTTTTTGGTYDNGTTTGTTTDTTTTTVTGTETTPGTSPTGYTDGNTPIVNGQQVPAERTNPTAPAHSPNTGLTATGTIVSWNHTELVLHTSTGIEHFKMMPDTTGYTTNFREGQVATVDFNRNEQGVLIAKQVRLGASTSATTTTMTTTPVEQPATTTTTDNTASTTTTQPTTTYTPPAPTTTEPAPAPAPETSVASETTNTSTRMPATASESPLVALLGVLALAGAAGLRRLL